jgi:hypothetical protein
VTLADGPSAGLLAQSGGELLNASPNAAIRGQTWRILVLIQSSDARMAYVIKVAPFAWLRHPGRLGYGRPGGKLNFWRRYR